LLWLALHDTPQKAAHSVPKYLQEQGYRILPVNPNVEHLFGEQCFPSLSAISLPVDIIEIFRPSKFAPAIISEAVKLSPKIIWLQLCIKSEEAKAIAEKHNTPFVQNHCLMVEHAKLLSK